VLRHSGLDDPLQILANLDSFSRIIACSEEPDDPCDRFGYESSTAEQLRDNVPQCDRHPDGNEHPQNYPYPNRGKPP